MKAKWKYKITMKRCTVPTLLVLVRTLSAALAFCSTFNLANAEEGGTYTNIDQSGDAPEWCGILTQTSVRGHDFDACRPIGTVFRDDPRLPEMVVVLGTDGDPLAVGRFEVTFEEWDRCYQGAFCLSLPHDNDWGRGRRPVINVAPQEVEQFLAWMTKVSGVTYRGMTDAEWVHVAKSDEAVTHEIAHFDADRTLEVGSLKPNAAGLYDTFGNVWEMTSLREEKDPHWPRTCMVARSRGGSWANDIAYVSAESVNALLVEEGNRVTGFRVVRDMRLLSPPSD